jgi:hypothetical protein
MEEQHAKELDLLRLKEQSMGYLQEKNQQLATEMREVRQQDLYLRSAQSAATSSSLTQISTSAAYESNQRGYAANIEAAVSPAPAVPSPVQKVRWRARCTRAALRCCAPHPAPGRRAR